MGATGRCQPRNGQSRAAPEVVPHSCPKVKVVLLHRGDGHLPVGQPPSCVVQYLGRQHAVAAAGQAEEGAVSGGGHAQLLGGGAGDQRRACSGNT